MTDTNETLTWAVIGISIAIVAMILLVVLHRYMRSTEPSYAIESTHQKRQDGGRTRVNKYSIKKFATALS